ncbi:hypothetical protein WDU94_002917 [Cyamophila willieti]
MMEEKKVRPHAVGSKVSQIATIFQNVPSSPAPDLILGGSKPSPASSVGSESERKAVDLLKESSSQVSVVRTQSHISRFHNARALFEKLGNEESGRTGIKPGEKVKSLSDLRSRSSSANSSLGEDRREGKRSPSRSPSPPAGGRNSSYSCQRTNGFNSSGDEKQNGFHPHHHPSHPHSTTPTQKSSSVPSLISPSAIKHFQQDQARAAEQNKLANGSSPASAGFKPEKPERKFNSRELIEKQKNWTAHFSKTKATPSSGATQRYNSDPSNFASVKVSSLGGAPPPAIPQKPNLPLASSTGKSFGRVVSPCGKPPVPSSGPGPVNIPQNETEHVFKRNTSVSPPPPPVPSERSTVPEATGSIAREKLPCPSQNGSVSNSSTLSTNTVETSSHSTPSDDHLAPSSLSDEHLAPSISPSHSISKLPAASDVSPLNGEMSQPNTNSTSNKTEEDDDTAVVPTSTVEEVRHSASSVTTNENSSSEDTIKSPDQITPDDSPNKSVISSSPDGNHLVWSPLYMYYSLAGWQGKLSA